MRRVLQIVCITACFMLVFAHDEQCSAREDNSVCTCDIDEKNGECMNEVCLCKSVGRRKRSPCTQNSHCRWCSGYCGSNGSCVCPV